LQSIYNVRTGNSPYNPLVHTYSVDEEWWSKGHGTIFDDADGNWYVIYHAYRKGKTAYGRLRFWQKVRTWRRKQAHELPSDWSIGLQLNWIRTGT
jgi:beta-xylosidase